MRSQFDDFVTARGGMLWRTAWLLTGDPDRAEELLVTALARVWSGRDHPTGSGALDDEALAALLVAYLRRRPGVAVGSTDYEQVGGPTGAGAGGRCTEADVALVAGLATLPPRLRVLVVLLHAERRAVDEVAALLGCSPGELAELHAEASIVLRRTALTSDPRAVDRTGRRVATTGSLDDEETYQLRRWLIELTPEPPYVPDRARAAVRRGSRHRNLGRLVAAGTALALIGLVATAWDSEDGAPAAVESAAVPDESRVRVAPLPIPDECVIDADPPARPDPPLDLDLAGVVWLRVCTAPDPAGALRPLAFAPDLTVVSTGLDPMVRGWVDEAASVTCAEPAPRPDGTVRIQLGTADGALHVVDAVVGPCGRVAIDGRAVPIDGRRVFAEAVAAISEQLADQYATQAPIPVPGASDEARCPRDPDRPGEADRTLARTYPDVPGMALPLPAEAALLCRYSLGSGAKAGPLSSSSRVAGPAADQIRVAYLAGPPPALRACRPRPGAGRYAVVLTDVTGSWRTFGLDRGQCDLLTGPGTGHAVAGHWLLERVLWGPGLTSVQSEGTWGMRVTV